MAQDEANTGDLRDNVAATTRRKRVEKWFDLYRTMVMPAHCDTYGHMNVRHYAAFFDDAAWGFPAMAGVSLSALRGRGLGTVAASLTIEFHHEIKAGDLVLIKGAITRVGMKSFSYEMRLYEPDSMTHCATQKSVEVCFDTAKRQSVPLPEDVKTKLQAVALAQ
jgi:acyl-CoA thioester hydrolase